MWKHHVSRVPEFRLAPLVLYVFGVLVAQDSAFEQNVAFQQGWPVASDTAHRIVDARSHIRQPASAFAYPAAREQNFEWEGRGRAVAGAETLRVLALNVWLDGSRVPKGIEKIVDVIHASGAHVVAFSEARQIENRDFLAQVIDGLEKKGLIFKGKHIGGDTAIISQWDVSGTTLVYNRFRFVSVGLLVASVWAACSICLFMCCLGSRQCSPTFASGSDSAVRSSAPETTGVAAFETSLPAADSSHNVQTSTQRAIKACASFVLCCMVLPLACVWFGRNVSIPLMDEGSIVVCRLKSPNSDLEILVGSAHLDHHSYSVYLPRAYQANPPWGRLARPNTDIEEIDQTERASMRLPAVHAFVNYMSSDDELRQLPAIFCGDFNVASHFDWTEATKALQDHHGVVYEFPPSTFLEGEGFIDAWRKVYPDPTTNPGSTWPSNTVLNESTSWAELSDERDRIDYIYYRSSPTLDLDAIDVSLVGSRGFYVYAQLVSDTGDDPFILEDKEWPSDHKAVLADFQISQRVL